jgi:hypothetical protein
MWNGDQRTRAGSQDVVRRNTERVQGHGAFDLFEELFADDFVDHTPQPGTTADKDGVPDFRPEIHLQTVDAMRVRDGRICEHWGVANPFPLVEQLGAHIQSW